MITDHRDTFQLDPVCQAQVAFGGSSATLFARTWFGCAPKLDSAGVAAAADSAVSSFLCIAPLLTDAVCLSRVHDRVDLVKEKVPAASKLYNDSGCAVQRGFFSRGAEFMR